MRFYSFVIYLVQTVHCSKVCFEHNVNSARGFFDASNELSPACKSQIYCESEFMHDVQLAHVYNDSKTFVDKKLKYNESEIINKYKELKDENGGKVPSNAALLKFVDEYLEDGDELEEWVPPDFTDEPAIANRIKDPGYKQWALGLNHVWKTLARKVKDDVRAHPDKYSLIWVPNGFIIPGGRFRELYYWDTYWIVNGLLLCDMTTTARGVIDNIISMVNRFGFVPNGGRVYYLDRSQPPVLTLTVLRYYEYTGDFDYVRDNLPALETEFQFWMENRLVKFQKCEKWYTMARYYVQSRGPRPESYSEDYKTAKQYNTEKKKNDLYARIKTAAETGWDFSSRWFITSNRSNKGNLSDTHAENIIPVDLNCIMHKNALTLSTWFGKMGKKKKADKYLTIANKFLNGIQMVLWRKDKGAWFDWDILNNKSREYFFVSNVAPLWTGSYKMSKKVVASDVLGYLKNQRIIEPDYSVRYNGTPTSLYKSSEQWDFPNAWAPLQAFIIQGLDRTEQLLAKKVASELANVWLRSNYKGFINNRCMFEKYNVLAEGESGKGGEYIPQEGFGWTNGFVFELLNRWNSTASYESNGNIAGDDNVDCFYTIK